MSFDNQPRQLADTIVGRIRTDFERTVRECLDDVLDTAARERAEAVEAAVAAARAETDAAVEAALACARGQWAAEHEAAVARACEEARRDADAEASSRAREELAREHEAALAQARDEARREASQEAVDQARDEARREHEEALAQSREKARQEHEEALARVREEAAADHARALAEVRAAAEQDAAAAVTGPRAEPARAPDEPHFPAEAARLRDAIARLDEAASLSECLDTLADGVSEHTGRSMVFVVRGHVLRGWRVSGFADAPASPASLSVPLDLSGDLWQVAERGRQKDVHPQTFGRDTDPALAFAHLETGAAGMATPVLVAGRTVALVYADSGGQARDSVSACWPECVEILARHTSRCLEALTAAKAAGMVPPQGVAHVVGRVPQAPALGHVAGPAVTGEPSAPPDLEAVTAAERYAKLLVSEVKLYNEAAIRVARHKKDIRTRLRAEIDRARRLYHERVPASVTTRDEIFEQELLRILADGQPELLGVDMPEAV